MLLHVPPTKCTIKCGKSSHPFFATRSMAVCAMEDSPEQNQQSHYKYEILLVAEKHSARHLTFYPHLFFPLATEFRPHSKPMLVSYPVRGNI